MKRAVVRLLIVLPFLVIGAVVLCFAGGLVFLVKVTVPKSEDQAGQLMASALQKQGTDSLGFAMEKVIAAQRVPASTPSAPPQRLAQNDASPAPSAGEELQRSIEALHADGAPSIRTLRNVYLDAGRDLENARKKLVLIGVADQIIANNPQERRELGQFMSEQARIPFAPKSSDPNNPERLAQFDLLAEAQHFSVLSESDPRQALDDTVAAINAQTDTKLRARYARELLVRFPGQREALLGSVRLEGF